MKLIMEFASAGIGIGAGIWIESEIGSGFGCVGWCVLGSVVGRVAGVLLCRRAY